MGDVEEKVFEYFHAVHCEIHLKTKESIVIVVRFAATLSAYLGMKLEAVDGFLLISTRYNERFTLADRDQILAELSDTIAVRQENVLDLVHVFEEDTCVDVELDLKLTIFAHGLPHDGSATLLVQHLQSVANT